MSANHTGIFLLYGVPPTKPKKHTLRDCTENEELLNTVSQRAYKVSL